MGRKSNLRDRPYAKEATSVQCQRCRKRIGLLWATDNGLANLDGRTPGYDGHWLNGAVDTQLGSILEGTKGPMLPNGFKDLANEDWCSITCKRCGHNWQGREHYLHSLVAGAPGGTVRLGDAPRPDRRSNGSAWAW